MFRYLVHCGKVIIAGGILLLTACGGGSSLNNSSGLTTVRGTVAKGLFTEGKVFVYAIRNGAKDSVPLGSGDIGGDGGYSISINYSGPLFLEATGKYLDEADVATPIKTLSSPLHAVVINIPSNISITPLTELAYRKAIAKGSLIDANITYANSLIGNLFKISDIITVSPLRYGATSTYDVTKPDPLEYTMVLAAISRLDYDNPAKDAMAIIADLYSSLNNDVMSPTMATSLQAAIITMAGTWRFQLPDIMNIGNKRVGVTLSVSNSSILHNGFQVTLKVPDNAFIALDPGTTKVVKPDYYALLIPPVPIGDAPPVVLNSLSGTVNILEMFSQSFTSADIITIYFDIPSGAAPPTNIEYNGLKITINNDQVSLDLNAILTAKDSATDTSITLTPNINIPLVGN